MKLIFLPLFFFSISLSQSLFFSEYAEGTSNNKYLEIFNPTSEVIDLTVYAFPSTANDPSVPGEHEYWNTFDAGATINPGDVYVICHGSADDLIQAECDQHHTYLSNGDDGYALVYGTENDYEAIDWIGDWNADPGTGWDVCGVSNGTKEHTLVRVSTVNSGNDWSESSSEENCEWLIYPQDTWIYVGSHPHNDDDPVYEDCSNGIDDDGNGFIDCEDWNCDGSIGDVDPNCDDGTPSEDCSNGIDDDGDGYIDCDDFDCFNDNACDSGGTGSCAEYGCVEFTPSNACQCNSLCAEYNNCCDDYEEICGGNSSEDCSNGIDDDGDSYIDCDDFDCSDDAACSGGGGDCADSMSPLFFSEYAEGSSNNKYLEIFNPNDVSINLDCYAFPSVANAPSVPGEHEYWNTFDSGASVDPGEVYVVCHGSSDPFILGECDQFHTYLSNGNDGYALVYGTEDNYQALDWIGDWDGDPGDGWEVCGVSDGTKDHTLVRFSGVTEGNEWSNSSDSATCEWQVYPQNTWEYLGFHNSDPNANISPTANAGEDQVVNFSELVTLDGSASFDIDGSIIGYEWSQISGPSITLSSYESDVVTFTAPDESGVLEFQLTVYDDILDVGTDNIAVTICAGLVSIASARSGGIDQCLSIQGVVTSPNFQSSYSEYTIQDESAGIVIFSFDSDLGFNYGDEVLITGITDEYNGKFELVVESSSNINVIGFGVIPDSQILTVEEFTNDSENYESEIITLQSVSLIDGSWPEEGSWANLTIGNGSFSTTLRIDEDTDIDGSIEPTWPLNITGVGGQYDSTEPYDEGYQLLARYVTDFEESTGLCTPNGDSNQDNSIDVLDIVLMINVIMGNSEFTNEQIQFCISDVNMDEALDVLDIVMLVNYILDS